MGGWFDRPVAVGPASALPHPCWEQAAAPAGLPPCRCARRCLAGSAPRPAASPGPYLGQLSVPWTSAAVPVAAAPEPPEGPLTRRRAAAPAEAAPRPEGQAVLAAPAEAMALLGGKAVLAAPAGAPARIDGRAEAAARNSERNEDRAEARAPQRGLKAGRVAASPGQALGWWPGPQGRPRGLRRRPRLPCRRPGGRRGGERGMGALAWPAGPLQAWPRLQQVALRASGRRHAACPHRLQAQAPASSHAVWALAQPRQPLAAGRVDRRARRRWVRCDWHRVVAPQRQAQPRARSQRQAAWRRLPAAARWPAASRRRPADGRGRRAGARWVAGRAMGGNVVDARSRWAPERPSWRRPGPLGRGWVAAGRPLRPRWRPDARAR
jgi:hypothetical protein